MKVDLPHGFAPTLRGLLLEEASTFEQNAPEHHPSDRAWHVSYAARFRAWSAALEDDPLALLLDDADDEAVSILWALLEDRVIDGLPRDYSILGGAASMLRDIGEAIGGPPVSDPELEAAMAARMTEA
jgi:hypothetical protein